MKEPLQETHIVMCSYQDKIALVNEKTPNPHKKKTIHVFCCGSTLSSACNQLNV